MSEILKVPFAKYEAVGNDFIVVSTRKLEHMLSLGATAGTGAAAGIRSLTPAALASAMCDRRLGIGADGLLIMRRPDDWKHNAKMQVVNADGSEAEMSGNGIRCAAAYVVGLGQTEFMTGLGPRLTAHSSKGAQVTIETRAGLRRVQMKRAGEEEWDFSVGMGAPVFTPAKIPFKGRAETTPVTRFPLETSAGTLYATVCSMGNPHCSIFVDDFETFDWKAVGRELERNVLFPNRTNVEFVRIISHDEIDVRFWERGVGQTQSSGTGSCAAAVAAVLNGHTGRMVRIKTLAGILEVSWESREVTLAGPVNLVSQGAYFLRA
jgi:diaminopimelate epimerase